MGIAERIRKKVRMWRFAHATPTERGKMLHEGYFENNAKVGEGCECHPRVPPFGSEPYLVTLGNHVRITEGVKFCTHDGGMWVLRNREDMKDADYFAPIVVEDNVHIGWNAIIMPGVRIGSDSVIGCGAVVTKDVPSGSIAVGVPARVVRSTEEYYTKYKPLVDHVKSMKPAEKKVYLSEKYSR